MILKYAKDKKNAKSREQNSAGKLNQLRMNTHTFDMQLDERKVASCHPVLDPFSVEIPYSIHQQNKITCTTLRATLHTISQFSSVTATSV